MNFQSLKYLRKGLFLLSKKNRLDQYYTSKEIADWCWERLAWRYNLSCEEFVEPSAGNGSFLREDVKITAYDLEPKVSGIIEKDFLTVDKKDLQGKIVIGNPPFGWASSLALKFLNHCSEAKVIAFILPRTFSKKLFQNKIDKNLHLVAEWDLPKNSFLLEGLPYDVPCCFQIWEREEYTRKEVNFDKHVYLCEDGNLLLRRVGGRAGKFVSEEDYTSSTTYRVKCSPETKTLIESCYEDIKAEASKTVGVRSITLDEINYILTRRLNEL